MDVMESVIECLMQCNYYNSGIPDLQQNIKGLDLEI